MAKILFINNFVFLSGVYSSIPIAHHLKAQGNQVGFICYAKTVPLLRKEGIDPVWDIPGLLLDKISKRYNFLSSWRSYLFQEAGRTAVAFFAGSALRKNIRGNINNIIKIINEWKPDVVICDSLDYEGIIAAEFCNLSYATSHIICLDIPSAFLPPFGMGCSPKAKKSLYLKIYGCGLNLLTDISDKTINSIRKTYGLSAVSGATFGLSPYLALVYTTEALEYERPDLPQQICYVGPCFSDSRGYDKDMEFPSELLGESPLIYVFFGMANQKSTAPLLTKIIAASKGQSWKVIISLGESGKEKVGPLVKQLSPNIFICGYVNQLELLKRTQLVVTHGGVNTIAEALKKGVPLLVIPQGAGNYENAQRVVEAKAGLRLNFYRASCETIRSAISQILENEAFKINAGKVAADFSKTDGGKVSAELILELIKRRSPMLRAPNQQPTIYAGEKPVFL